MGPQDRANSYLQSFPKYSPLQIFNDRIYGIWIIGNLYKRANSFYGSYPHNLQSRIEALFPDRKRTMHLFSGTIQGDGDKVVTFDISPEFNPNICDDVRNISKYSDIVGEMDLIISDPPYENKDFERYGQSPFSKWKVIKWLGSAMKVGSHLAWLDLRVPMYSRKEWRLLGYIGVIVSTNTRVRCLTLLERI